MVAEPEAGVDDAAFALAETAEELADLSAGDRVEDVLVELGGQRVLDDVAEDADLVFGALDGLVEKTRRMRAVRPRRRTLVTAFAAANPTRCGTRTSLGLDGAAAGGRGRATVRATAPARCVALARSSRSRLARASAAIAARPTANGTASQGHLCRRGGAATSSPSATRSARSPASIASRASVRIGQSVPGFPRTQE